MLSRLAALLALAAPAVAVTGAFPANTLLVLRVGDGAAPLLATGAVPAARAAGVWLDSIDPAFAATPLASLAVPGVVIAGNDYSMGTLQLGEGPAREQQPAGRSHARRSRQFVQQWARGTPQGWGARFPPSPCRAADLAGAAPRPACDLVRLPRTLHSGTPRLPPSPLLPPAHSSPGIVAQPRTAARRTLAASARRPAR
jgi:hypothetical protein